MCVCVTVFQLLDGCLRVLDERKMLASLLSQCQGISSSIQSHVNTLRERGVKGGREGGRERGEGGREGGREV